jgi:hypothetical protein
MREQGQSEPILRAENAVGTAAHNGACCWHPRALGSCSELEVVEWDSAARRQFHEQRCHQGFAVVRKPPVPLYTPNIRGAGSLLRGEFTW